MLKTLATYAFENAPSLCDANHGCCDYHRIWGIARLAQSNAAEPAGAFFIHQCIRDYGARNHSPRILVCGGADHGVPQMINEACMHAGLNAEILFADRCATPVRLNTMYAENEGIPLKARQADLLQLEEDPVDVIVAHSLLNFFSPGERSELFRTWSHLLKPGGIVLISNRMAQSPELLPNPPDQQTLSDRLQALDLVGTELGFDRVARAELADAAQRVWNKNLKHRVSLTRLELDTLTDEYDFSLQSFTEHGRNEPGQRGPIAQAYSDQAVRAEICLRK